MFRLQNPCKQVCLYYKTARLYSEHKINSRALGMSEVVYSNDAIRNT